MCKVGQLDPQLLCAAEWHSWCFCHRNGHLLLPLSAFFFLSFLHFAQIFLLCFQRSLFCFLCRSRLLVIRMFSAGQVRWCFWAPLVLLALVSNFPSKAQGQGKHHLLFSDLLSLLLTFPSHSSPLLLSCSPPSDLSLPLNLPPFTTLASYLPPVCSLHHSPPLLSLQPHLSDLLYLHIPPLFPAHFSICLLSLMCRLGPITVHHDHITSISFHPGSVASAILTTLLPMLPSFIGEVQ